MDTKTITIQPSNSLAPSQRRIENLDAAFLIVISFMIFSTISTLIYAYIPKSRQHSVSFDKYHPVPCYRCQYFSNNTYLQCTVHPVTALTEQASDCRDFCPHNRKIN